MDDILPSDREFYTLGAFRVSLELGLFGLGKFLDLLGPVEEEGRVLAPVEEVGLGVRVTQEPLFEAYQEGLPPHALSH